MNRNLRYDWAAIITKFHEKLSPELEQELKHFTFGTGAMAGYTKRLAVFLTIEASKFPDGALEVEIPEGMKAAKLASWTHTIADRLFFKVKTRKSGEGKVMFVWRDGAKLPPYEYLRDPRNTVKTVGNPFKKKVVEQRADGTKRSEADVDRMMELSAIMGKRRTA